MIDLFSSNGGCDFPCWWGIRQGDPIRKVSELSSTIGESLGSDNLSYNYTLSLDKFNFADLDVKFYVDDNQVVERMEVFLGQPSRFREYHAVLEERLSLSSILSRYGKPNEVLFLAAPLSEPASSRPYAVFVIYNEPGFGIVYSGNTDLDDPLRVCSIQINDHRVEDIALYLQEPRNDIQKLNRYFLNDFQPLEKVTSMSLDDFYRSFTTPGSDECIESPVDLWQ